VEEVPPLGEVARRSLQLEVDVAGDAVVVH
jgi:hypothetical protein